MYVDFSHTHQSNSPSENESSIIPDEASSNIGDGSGEVDQGM